MTNNILIVIVGPTAIGKTSLSIKLAEHFNTTILSADSRQFFKELTIGTAKPKEKELASVAHYFINSHSITDEYNVGKYEKDAINLLNNLFKSSSIQILVGGSGLYIDAVCKGFDNLPKADEIIRNDLKLLFQNKGLVGLQELLLQLDVVYYHQVDLNNPQRLMRALEVCLSTNKPYSHFRIGMSKKRNFKCIKIGLTIEREELHKNINSRVDAMMNDGLIDEVKSLLAHKNLNSLQTVGYKEMFDYLENKVDLSLTIELIKQHTRQFAKRQLTWFRKDLEIEWFNPNNYDAILSYINHKLNS